MLAPEISTRVLLHSRLKLVDSLGLAPRALLAKCRPLSTSCPPLGATPGGQPSACFFAIGSNCAILFGKIARGEQVPQGGV